jgi:hypothetical protein
MALSHAATIHGRIYLLATTPRSCAEVHYGQLLPAIVVEAQVTAKCGICLCVITRTHSCIRKFAAQRI